MFWMNSAVFLSNYSEKLIIVEVSQSFQIFKFTTVSHCPSKVFSQKKSLYRNNFASFNSKLHLHLPLHSLSCSRAISGIGLGSMEMSVHTDSMSTFGTKKCCSNGILPSGLRGWGVEKLFGRIPSEHHFFSAGDSLRLIEVLSNLKLISGWC